MILVSVVTGVREDNVRLEFLSNFLESVLDLCKLSGEESVSERVQSCFRLGVFPQDPPRTRLRFEAYEVLPATDANEALLSLAAQHPSATVDRDPAHYQAAEMRMFPHG